MREGVTLNVAVASSSARDGAGARRSCQLGRISRPKLRAVFRPAEVPGSAVAGRDRRRADLPEPDRPGRSSAEGSVGWFRPAAVAYGADLCKAGGLVWVGRETGRLCERPVRSWRTWTSLPKYCVEAVERPPPLVRAPPAPQRHGAGGVPRRPAGACSRARALAPRPPEVRSRRVCVRDNIRFFRRRGRGPRIPVPGGPSRRWAIAGGPPVVTGLRSAVWQSTDCSKASDGRGQSRGGGGGGGDAQAVWVSPAVGHGNGGPDRPGL